MYHLTLDDQLDLLRRASGVPMILDTHINTGTHTHTVTETEQVGEYRGCWYTEPGQITSSWGNPRSFWPTLESHQRMLDEAGYHVVLAADPWYLPDRTFFLCLPG